MRKTKKLRPINHRQNILALLEEAQGLANEGRLDLASRVLRKGLSIARLTKDKRGESLIHSEMGLCYQEQGKRSQALKEFEKAYRAAPRSSTCLLMLGTSYLDKGDLENAGKYLTHALIHAGEEYRQASYAKDPSNLLNACLLLSKASRNLAAKALKFGLQKFPGHPLLKEELQAVLGNATR